MNENKKAELDAYQIKDVAQMWYKIWADGRAPGEHSITWDILNKFILGEVLSREQRESKVEEFINL